MYLVDTSVWIRHFSKRDSFDLRSICRPEERVLCLPVYQEILQGIGEDTAFRRMKIIMENAVIVDDPIDRALVMDAVSLYRLARRQGVTVRSSIDCLIAASGIRHGLVVLHSDRDYSALAQISELRQQQAE
ncbi:MAG: PIN domain-containing protein [Spirochaetaceae bacterium]